MFTPEVIEQLQYYVYRLIDPRNGQTFYVGKGKGNRVFAHVEGALKNYKGQKFEDKDEDEVSAKIQQIREIKNAGLEVIHIIQRYGLTEKEAFEVEAALIDVYGELTNLQSGHNSDRGVYEIEGWQDDTLQLRSGRFEFYGHEATKDIKNIFINKKIPAKYRKKGMASPVLYSK